MNDKISYSIDSRWILDDTTKGKREEEGYRKDVELVHCCFETKCCWGCWKLLILRKEGVNTFQTTTKKHFYLNVYLRYSLLGFLHNFFSYSNKKKLLRKISLKKLLLALRYIRIVNENNVFITTVYIKWTEIIRIFFKKKELNKKMCVKPLHSIPMPSRDTTHNTHIFLYGLSRF